jgi:hypothetical protein
LSNQFSIPNQQHFWSRQSGEFPHGLSTKSFSLVGQKALLVRKPHSPATKLFAENQILLTQMFQSLLLALIHQSRKRCCEEAKRIHSGHSWGDDEFQVSNFWSTLTGMRPLL